MATDLGDFFAKKASKSKKKSNALNVGDLVQRLERNTLLQEECEQEEALETQANNENLNESLNSEDSEWIDPSANKLPTNFEELGIKDMTASNLDDDEEVESVKDEPMKTWNTAKNKPPPEDDDDGSKPENETDVAPPSIYKPPFKYQIPNSRRVKLDLANEEMFPSLAAADEKVKEEKAKGSKVKTDQSEGWQDAAPVVTPRPNKYVPPQLRNREAL